MRYVLATLAAFCLWSLAAAPAAQAQQLPQGSYLQSCRDVGVEGGVLSGLCRTRGGEWQRAALGDIRQCAGDIGNSNGQLVCNRATGGLPAYGAGAPPAEHRDMRLEQHQLRCQGIVDPMARERCLNRR
jgi:hypothetical protein